MSAERRSSSTRADARRLVHLACPSCGRENIAAMAKRAVYMNRRAPVYTMPCCGAELDSIRFRHAVGGRSLAPDKG